LTKSQYIFLGEEVFVYFRWNKLYKIC